MGKDTKAAMSSMIIMPMSNGYDDIREDLRNLARLMAQKGKQILLLGPALAEGDILGDVPGVVMRNPMEGLGADFETLLLHGRGDELTRAIMREISGFDTTIDHVINGAGARLITNVLHVMELPLNSFYLFPRSTNIDSVLRFDPFDAGERVVAERLWTNAFSQTTHDHVVHRAVIRDRNQAGVLPEGVEQRHFTDLVRCS